MTIRTIECADCGAPVPSGRLACPSCGALLAAVAGAPPPPIRIVEMPSPEPEAADPSKKASKAKSRAAANGATANRAVAPGSGSDGSSQPATKRASQAMSRAATAAGRAATAATAKAKTTAAAATAAVTPAKGVANGAIAEESVAASTDATAAKPRSPGKVAAAIAIAVAAGPTTKGAAPDAATVTVAPKASGGSRPYPVPTPAAGATPPVAASAAPAAPPPAAAPPSRPARAAAMPASVPAPPTASARSVPIEPPARPAPGPAAAPRRTSATQTGPESATGSAPAQLAYLIDPAPDGNGRSRAPELTTNGTSSYLLDANQLDEALVDESDSPWPPLLQPEPALVGRPYVSGTITAGSAVAMPPRPGAYLPPNSVMPPSSVSRPAQLGRAGTRVPAAAASDTTATVGTQSPTTAPAPMPGGPPPDAGGGDPTSSSGGGPSIPRDAIASVGSAVTSLVDRIDRDRVTEVAGWFVVAGSALATLGFLMPWSAVVIGARGSGGYLDDWGLASPTHLFVVIALLGVLALSVLENPVPAWLRTGVLGLALGGLLLGLTWPYAIGPLGAQIGATVTFLGSFALLIGGIVAAWATRHGKVHPAV